MHVFFELEVIEILDGVAVCLFAASATCRGRLAGANLAGSVILGCIVALFAPLLREGIAHGPAGLILVIKVLPIQAFVGSCAALTAIFILGNRSRQLFFWLDSMSICLAGALYPALILPELGIAGALILALACAFIPGILRDVALGDVAMLADKNWYGASAAISAIISISIIIWSTTGETGPLFSRTGEIATLTGAGIGLFLRYWKGRDMEDM